MTPTPPDDAHSPLATLRQLKDMLDTGAITPQEYEALKQRLVFGAAPGPGPAEAAAPPAEVPPTPYLDGPAALTPEATPLLTPEPDWLAAPAPPLPLGGDEEYDETPAAERRNPLNLVFAIGGLLLFLGVMAYLAWGRPRTPDEHLTSTTLAAADTAAVAPETGPQAEQLTLPPAAPPETVRVAPAPRLTAAPTIAADSAQPAAAPATAPATAMPAPKAAAPKAAAPKPSAAPAATDTTGTGQ